MAGPLPADHTPLRAGGHPSQSLLTARRVAQLKPMEGGDQREVAWQELPEALA